MAISSSSLPRTAKLYNATQRIQQLEETRSRSLDPKEQQQQTQLLRQTTKEKKKLQLRLNVQFMVGVLLLVAVILAVARALPEDGAIFWLFQVPPSTPQAVGDFATMLAPFLAIAVAIERLLETVFNWFEQSSRAVADVLVAPRETLDWIGREYQDAYAAAEEAAQTVGVETDPESLHVLELAEERLAKAEERLRSWVTSPEYLAWKKALSIWVGLLAGLVIAIVGDLKMLQYIGIPSPRVVDMMITGLVIGSGPGPMHDLIGFLQSGRSALNNLSELAKGKSIREKATAALQTSKKASQTTSQAEEV